MWRGWKMGGERNGRHRDVGAEETRVERGCAGRADEIRHALFRKGERQAQMNRIHVGQALVMEPVLTDEALEHKGVGPLVVVESVAHAVNVGKVLAVHVVHVLLTPDDRLPSSCAARRCPWRPTVAAKVSPPPYGADIVVCMACHGACLAHPNRPSSLFSFLGPCRTRETRVDHLGLVPLGIRAPCQRRVCQQRLCLHVGHLFRRQHALHGVLFETSRVPSPPESKCRVSSELQEVAEEEGRLEDALALFVAGVETIMDEMRGEKEEERVRDLELKAAAGLASAERIKEMMATRGPGAKGLRSSTRRSIPPPTMARC